MKKIGVYRILNLISGRSYVGSSKNLVKRMAEHRQRLRLGHHKNVYLQAAWNKYGEEAFCFGIVVECDLADITDIEQRYIDEFRAYHSENGYNLRKIAVSNAGLPASEKQRRVTRERMRGVKNPKFSEALKAPERAAKSRQQLESFRRDPEIEAKRAAAIRKAYENPELRAKQGQDATGRRHSTEEVKRISARVKRWQDDRIANGYVPPRDPKTGRLISTKDQTHLGGNTALSAMTGTSGQPANAA